MIAAILALVLATDPIPNAKRVLILGDSITATGQYAAYLEGYYVTRYPDRAIEFINLGLPSETVSGLSEPSHPWPRPNVHERLDRALDKLKPDVVIACYGMNDGIYAPFSEERFASFRAGIDKIVEGCKRRKVPPVLITPPPFDPAPIRAKLKGDGAEDYGWMTPYARYQENVLSRYAAWVRDRAEKGVTTIDAQEPITNFVRDQRVKFDNREYRLADDGVHMNADGHWLIAVAILDGLHTPLTWNSALIDASTLRAARGDVKEIRAEAGGVRFVWNTQLPIPRDPDWSEAITSDRSSEGRMAHHLMTIDGLADGRYNLYEGTRSVGSVHVEKGTVSIDLRKFAELSTNRRSDELGALIRKRERIMSPAWLDYVGHTRPDTVQGLPLDEAKKLAEPISAEIRRLSRPVTLELSLRAN